MKKINFDNRSIVKYLPIAILVVASIVSLVFWTPNLWSMGSYFLYSYAVLVAIAVVIYTVYEWYLMNRTSRKYPKGIFLLKDFASLILEMIILSGAYAVLLHFDLLHVDNYLFVLFLAGLFMSIVQKVYWVSLLVDNYNENTGENWSSLTVETKKEANYICTKNAILVMILLFPIAVWINLQLGVALGLIVGAVLVARLFEITVKG